MTDPFLGLAAACVVQIAEIDLQPTADGWTETLHLEIAVRATYEGHLGAACPTMTLELPPGARIQRAKGRTTLVSGQRSSLRDFRFETTRPRVDRSRSLVVHLPELANAGDRAVLDLVRTRAVGPVTLVDVSARYLRVAGPAATIDAPEGLTRDDDRGSVWGRDVAGVTVTVTTDLQRSAPVDAAAAASGVTVEGRQRLVIPRSRDALVTLYPGGGSSIETRLFVTLPPSDHAVSWVVPAPEGSDVSATVRPPSRATVATEFGIARIEAPPSEGSSVVELRWETPDAPTYGVVPEDLGPGSPAQIVGWEVDGGRGTVVWDDARHGWALLGIDEQAVVPDEARFLRGLGARFDRQAVPEPGLPARHRGRPASLALAAELSDSLRERVGIATPDRTWPHDPLWPRKLRKAQRSGAVTPTEAALLLWLMVRQTGLSATWGFVRPASGPDDDVPFVSPGGYDRPVVIVRDSAVTDEPWFLDPSCEVCAPFELPRELWGSALLSPELERTPPPPRGDIEVGRDAEGRLTLKFAGQTALELRREMGTRETLAARFGPIAEIAGLTTPGEPIEMVLRDLGTDYDPLDLGSLAGSRPFAVVPGRRILRTEARNLPDVDLVAGSLRYHRSTRDGVTVEKLEIKDAWVAPGQWASIVEARDAVPTSTSEPEANPTQE